MSKFTYWSSQSFRTLNHWQSNISEPVTLWTGELFSAFKIDGGYYPLPIGIKEPNSIISQGYVWGGTDSRNRPYVLSDGASPNRFSLYGSMKHITPDNKHIVKAVWDCGTVKMTHFTPVLSGVGGADFPLTILSCTFKPIPGESGTYEPYSFSLTTPTYGDITTKCCIPKFQKYYGAYCWYSEGYENLIPQLMRDIQGAETPKTYSGSVTPVTPFSDYQMTFGPPHFGILELNDIYDDSTRWYIRIHGNVEKFSDSATALPRAYSSLGGSTTLPYIDTDDANMLQNGFSQACSLIGDEAYSAYYSGNYPLHIGFPGNTSLVCTGWGQASSEENIYNYDLGAYKYTRNYNSIRLFDNGVQVGAVYSTMIYRPIEITVEDVDIIRIER